MNTKIGLDAEQPHEYPAIDSNIETEETLHQEAIAALMRRIREEPYTIGRQTFSWLRRLMGLWH